MISLLYIDDEPGLLELGKLFLESAGGFEVSTAESGDEGLGQLAQHDFDAIVSDFQMPGMDGIELLKKVRKTFGTIPFVLFTGRGREEVVIEAINNGVDFYLQKGGDPKAQFAELAHKVRQSVSRRRAETALSDSEKRLADIINFLPDSTFAIDTRGVVIAWNRAMERMTGVRAEDVLGKGDYEYALPFYHERRPLLINLVLENDPAIGEKYPFVKKEGRNLFSEIRIPHFNDGRGAALWFTASPLYDRKGEIAGAIESIRDITERKRAEEARSESEKRFRELADLLPQGIYESDMDGRMTYVNRLALEMFGYTAEDVEKGLNAMNVIAPEDRKRAGTVFAKMVDTGTREQGNEEYRAVRKDGSLFPISIYSSPIFRNDRVSGVRGVIIDITDRRKAEETLLSANREYTSLLDQIQDVYYRSDTGGRLVRASRSWATLLGYNNVSECIGRSIADDFYFKASDRNLLLDEITRKGKVTGYEVTLKKKTGAPVLVEVSSHPYYDAQGNIIGIEGTFRDITERKKAEDEIRAANEQLVASDEELRAQYDELALGEQRARMSESRLRYMLGFDEHAKKSEKELLGYAIEGAGLVTGSTLGYLAFLNEDESELSMYAWSKNAMAECSMMTKPIVYKTVKTGLWGEAVRQRRPVITNDYAAPDPAKKGYPQGHPDIIRHMNVPVMDEGHIILVAGVANKSSDYTENDVNELLLLMQGLWNILKRRRAEESVKNSLVFLNALIDQSPSSTWIADEKGFLIRMNAACERLLHAREADLAGKYNILNDNIVEEQGFIPLVRSVFDEGRVVSFTIQYDSARLSGLDLQDPVKIILEVTIFPVKNAAGTITNAVIIHNDITERKSAEAKLQAMYEQVAATEEELREQYEELSESERRLRENEENFQHMVESAPDPIYISVGDRFAYVNPAMIRLVGATSADQLLGRPLYERIQPDFHEVIRERAHLIIGDNAPAGLTETQYLKMDGTPVWVQSAVAPFQYNKQFAGLVILRDITGHKKAEAALREKTEELDQYFSTSLDLFCIADTGGYFRRLNPEWERTLGYSLADLEGKRFLDFVHPDDQQATLDAMGDLKSQKEVLNFTNRFRHRDGTYRWIEWRSMPKGDLVFAAARDITERKNADAALVESEAKFRNIIDNAPAGMHFYELKPDGALVFTGSNPGADRILGIEHNQFIGKTIEEAFPPLGETEVPAQYRRVAREGGVWQTDQVTYDGVAIHGAYAVTAFQISPGAMVAMFMDITARKRAETELKTAYERVAAAEEDLREQYDTLAAAQAEISSRRQQLEEIASTVPGVVYQFFARPDGSRGVYYASSRTNEIFGLESDLGRFFPEFTDCVHPDDRPGFLSSIEDAVKRKTDWHFEGRFTRKTGETIWFEGISSPVVHGNELVFTGVILDITERKRMEEAIRESEGRYRSLVELSPDAVVVHQGGKVLYANPAALHLAGAKKDEEIIAREVISFIHPDDRAMALEDFRQLYEEGKIIPLKEERLLRINGDPYTVEVIASPIQYLGSLSVLAVFRDVTERKRAEAALCESEEKYRSLVENIPFGITLIDADHRIVISNAAQGQMFHTDAGLWTGRYCYREFEKRDAVCTHCPGTRAMATGVRHEVETEGVRDDGTRFNARIHAIPLLDNEGRRTRFIEVVEDITERKTAEDALRQNEEKYRALVETTGTGFVILDHEGRVLDANPEYIRMTGHTRLEDISGRSVTGWTAAHEQERNADAVRQCIRDGFIRNFEIDYTDNSGTITPVEINAKVVQSEGAVHILTLCRDITERKRVENELLRLKISTDRSSDEVFWMDFAGNILYVNDAACRITGYSREEFLRMKIFELDPDLPPEIWDASVTDLRERKTQFLTTRHRRKDGAILDVEIVAVYVNQYDQEYSFAYVRDVTGRKRTEDALFNSQQMLQAVLDSIPQRVFWKDRNSVFLGCNKPLALDAGYTDPADMVGKTDYDHASHATADLYRADDRMVMETGQPRINFEEPQVRPDGSQAWLRTTKVPLRDKEGTIIGVLGTYEDITDRKKADAARRESEARLSSILHGSPVLQFVIDRDHQVISWNKAMEEYSGIRAADMIGTDQQWRAFYPEKRAVLADLLVDGNTNAISRLYAGKFRQSRYVEEAFEATDYFPHMGSSGIWLSFTAAPIRDIQGNIIGAVETLEDVTERVTAENALRESSERTRTILDTAQAGIVLVDAATHQIVDANKKALELIGLDRDSVIGAVCHRFICPAEEGKCPVTDCGQKVDTSERILITASGEKIPVLKTVVPVSISGRDVLVESFVDIAEQKRSEAAIREANRKLNLLNSITRHDIRNQLTVAQGYTQLAALSKPDSVVMDFLAKITAAIETIQRQIEFTKAYQELGVHAPAWFRLVDVISIVRPEKVTLHNTCKAVEIFADPMIDKVFFNLFDNAMKYGERVTTVTVGCGKRKNSLVITFADNGTGIAPGEKQKIFEKGYGKNTGLGLFLVREILAITDITISETGTPGEGAVFEITVPEGAYRNAE